MKFIHDWIWIVIVAFCVLGIFFPIIGIFALICMLAPVVFAIFKGRFWCGNFCPRGSLNDVLLKKISLTKNTLFVLKNVLVRNTFMILLLAVFAIQLFFAFGNWSYVGTVFVRMILITTGLSIILGIFFMPRTWCQICPMGTMANYVSRLSFSKKHTKHVKIESDLCVSCKACNKACPMELDVFSCKEQDSLKNPDCIKCRLCVKACKKGAAVLN